MKRRRLLGMAAALSLAGCAPAARRRLSPDESTWAALSRSVGGRLRPLQSPFAGCEGAACDELFAKLRNPYYLGSRPELTQTLGWLEAWTTASSAYAIAAVNASDVAAAIGFAREHGVRLVVKGGGHSYQGTSCAADSLLVWTHAMRRIELHDAFVPEGCANGIDAQPAVSVGAGATWGEVYNAVTTGGGRYVQGGGCTTVGVAGLVQGGGFGSFSKRYGLAAAGLLEAEVVTADGVRRIANACRHPDLFWALKGGGGGTFGIVTRVTLRTRDLPDWFGGVSGMVRARTPDAFRRLVRATISFYREALFNAGWGEQLRFEPGNSVAVAMAFQGRDARRAGEEWQPFVDWVAARPEDFSWDAPLRIAAIPARRLWDAAFLEQHAPGLIVRKAVEAVGAPFYWAGDGKEAGQFLHGYRSAWLPASLLERDRENSLAEALFRASRHWPVALHFNKGLAGAPASELAAARECAIHPAALDSFALAIVAGNAPPALPGVPGHEPDLGAARRNAGSIGRAMDELLALVAQHASYIAEGDFFQVDWPRAFWGSNYPRLLAVKRRYDPEGLFSVHHGVGSERSVADGSARAPRD